jgi:hypothetical protein
VGGERRRRRKAEEGAKEERGKREDIPKFGSFGI